MVVRKKLEECIDIPLLILYNNSYKLDMEKDSCHGGWAKGYWEGRLSALEDIYGLLAQRID